MGYEHAQSGYLGVGTVVLMVIVGTFVLPDAFTDSQTVGFAILGLMVGVMALVLWFSRLVVTVERGQVRASFGAGWPTRTIDLADVVRSERVRNTWVQGWGVRKITGGWMYNVWGLDAVEFEMGSGEIARVGTNDVDNLLATVRVHIP